MSLDITNMTNVLASYAAASGLFDKVNTHEPKSAPGNGLTAALWLDSIEPLGPASGLSITSGRVVFILRPYLSMMSEPQDGIDLRITTAVDALFTAYSGDFDLGSNVRNVDLLGQYGVGLSARAGYLNQDNKVYRTLEMTIPLIVNDLWTQVS